MKKYFKLWGWWGYGAWSSTYEKYENAAAGLRGAI